jgi:nicotinate-nucleotide adenylyltransferase
VGHLVVAQDVHERLRLDRMVIVTAGRPPHRTAAFPADDRLRMVRAAFAGDDRFTVSDVELRRPGPSYTLDTLEWLHDEFQPEVLYLVIGADQLRALHTWHEPERILELATLAVMRRPGEEVMFLPRPLPFEAVEVTAVWLSSTRVRQRLADGQSIRYLVPEAIRQTVEELWAHTASSDREASRAC